MRVAQEGEKSIGDKCVFACAGSEGEGEAEYNIKQKLLSERLF